MRGFTYRYMKKEGVVLLVCLWGWEFYSILFKHLKERGVCMKQGMKSILVAAVVLSISRGSYAAEYPHYYELPGYNSDSHEEYNRKGTCINAGDY